MYSLDPARLMVVVALVLIGSAAPVRSDVGPLDAADHAYAAEDYPRALALYEQVLAADPANLRALIRSARMLSWDGHLERSIERYDEALAVEPDNRPALLGRAVVLSWDGQLDRAIEELEKLYARFEGDREIRLSLARTLAWKGEYVAAREHYDALLASDPGDLEAMLGIARTYGWEGDLSRAGEEYDRVLALDPDNKDAKVGQGYLALWSGDVDGAEREVAALEASHPDDRDVRDLRKRVDRAGAPAFRVQADQTDDTDDNRLRAYSASGGWKIARRTRFELGVARYEMEDPVSQASIDNVNAALQTSPARGSRLRIHAGVDRRELTTGDRESDLLGGLSYRWGLDRRWQLGARAERQPVRYSPTITDNGITFDEIELQAAGAIGSRWRVELYGGAASASDDNDRVHFIGYGGYRWPLSSMVLETGYLLRYLDYDQDLSSGYFDPQDFLAHLARVRGRGKFGSSKVTYAFGVDAGIQSFTLGGADVDNDSVLVLSGSLGFPINDEVTLELFGYRGDYAAQTAAGFESRQLGLRLRWRIGRGD